MQRALLFATWLLLNASLAPGHLLLAAALALLLPRPPQAASLRIGGTLLRLGVTVAWDIVTSNIEVARRVLGPQQHVHPAFVWVPLDLREPNAIAVLASIVTLTPGSLTAEISPDGRHLLVHALHCDDAAALIAGIKTRYEAPLAALFR